MSLLFFDGFNSYTFLPLRWEECTKDCQFSVKPNIGREGTNAALCIHSGFTDTNFDHLGKNLESPTETVIMGFAFKKIKSDYGFIEINFNKGEAVQSKIKLYDTSFVWFNGTESINYGINYSLTFNDWNYFEVKIKTHSTLGSVEVHINENVALTLTDLNTTTVAFNYIDKIRLRLRHAAQTNEDYAYIDDLYIANTLGTYNNDFLGNCTVSAFYPAAQGANADFSLPPTISGVENYTLINDQPYVEDSTVYNNTFLEYASEDDGYYNTQTGVTFSNTATTMNINTYTSKANCLYFRFSQVSIPKHALITKVNLQLYVELRQINATYSDVMETSYSFQKSGTSVSQVTDRADLDSRPVTTACIRSKITYVDPLTQNYKDSLQELVSSDDWQEESNSVLFLIKLTLDYAPNNMEVFRVRSYNYSNDPYSNNTPKLYVEWQLPGESSGTYITSTALDNIESYSLASSLVSSPIFALSHNIIAKRHLDRANTDDLCLLPIITDGFTTSSGGNKLYFKDTTYSQSYSIHDINPLTSTTWASTDLQNYDFGFITTYSG